MALCASSTVAAATNAARSQMVNPLATISMLGSPAAAQTICGNQTATVSSSATVAATATSSNNEQSGCVLPVVDAAPPPVAEAAPASIQGPAYATPTYSLGAGGILMALVGLLPIFITLVDKDDDVRPISPF